MQRSSENDLRTLSQRNSELLQFVRALEDKVTQLCQQPNDVCLRISSAIFFIEVTINQPNQT